MRLRDRIKARIQDWGMRGVNDLRPETVAHAAGDVLEVGFGTGLNLPYYEGAVRSVTGVDPMRTEGIEAVDQRIERTSFPVERETLRADRGLPFDAGRFDCVVTTWTLCTIPDPLTALAEMRRVLKPGGSYVFIEHGRSHRPATARWQDRINPIWRPIMNGCNINRRIDELVEKAGFELTSMDRFRASGPGVLASMYRGVARRDA